MTSSKNKFNSEIAVAQINLLLDTIEDHPGITVREIKDLLDLRNIATLRRYIIHLTAEGDIEPTKHRDGYGYTIKARKTRVATGASYKLKEGRGFGGSGAERCDSGEARVEIRRHWVLNLVRDPLVAALFGPARVAA